MMQNPNGQPLDWSYVTDPATRAWVESLPIDGQRRIHGREAWKLQREMGDSLGAMAFAMQPGRVELPADWDGWSDDRKEAFYIQLGVEAKARIAAERDQAAADLWDQK